MIGRSKEIGGPNPRVTCIVKLRSGEEVIVAVYFVEGTEQPYMAAVYEPRWGGLLGRRTVLAMDLRDPKSAAELRRLPRSFLANADFPQYELFENLAFFFDSSASIADARRRVVQELGWT